MRNTCIVKLFQLMLLTLLSFGFGQTVSFWHTMSDAESEALDTVIEQFEAANPGIDVAATRYAYDDFKSAILTSLAGGQAPDTARLDIVWVPEFAELGALVALDQAMPDFKEIAATTFEGPLATNLWQGNYFGLPEDTNTQVLLWHAPRFEEAGLDGPPETMAEFAELACTLAEPDQDQYGYALGGTYFWAPAPIFYAMGGQVVDEEISTAEGYINGPESVEAFELLVDLHEQECISPNLLGGGIGTAQGHGTGQYAMIIDGPWMVDIYRADFPEFEVNFALVPQGPDNRSSSVVGGQNVVVFEGADEEASLEWVRYLLSEEAQLTMAQAGVVPTRADLFGNERLPEYFDVFLEQLRTAQARVPHPSWSEMDNAINNAFQRMLRGDQDAQEALDQAAQEINALLDE